MSEIIGKPLDEIRQLDIDVDGLSERQLCYIVALGIGEVKRLDVWTEKNYHPSTHFMLGDRGDRQFIPNYTSSWEHAGRVLETMPFVSLFVGDKIVVCSEHVGAHPNSIREYYNVKGADLKTAITKAAAKCVLGGIELEVKDE